MRQGEIVENAACPFCGLIIYGPLDVQYNPPRCLERHHEIIGLRCTRVSCDGLHVACSFQLGEFRHASAKWADVPGDGVAEPPVTITAVEVDL